MDQQKQEWITQYKIENPNYNWYLRNLQEEIKDKENIELSNEDQQKLELENDIFAFWITFEPNLHLDYDKNHTKEFEIIDELIENVSNIYNN